MPKWSRNLKRESNSALYFYIFSLFFAHRLWRIIKSVYRFREYLAVFKKTVQVHEVFLQRLSSHPVFSKDRNFQIFLEYDQDVSLPLCLGQSCSSQTRKQRDSERDCWHCLFPAKLQCWQFTHKWREVGGWVQKIKGDWRRETSCLVQRKTLTGQLFFCWFIYIDKVSAISCKSCIVLISVSYTDNKDTWPSWISASGDKDYALWFCLLIGSYCAWLCSPLFICCLAHRKEEKCQGNVWWVL